MYASAPAAMSMSSAGSRPSPAGLKGLLLQLEEAARALDGPKRITLV